MRNRLFAAVKNALILTCLFVIGAQAEATKEIYGDGGLYAVPASGIFTNLQIFGGSGGATSLDKTGVAGTPEGKKVIEQTTPAGQASFWGIINTSAGGSQTVVEKNYSDYLGGALRFWLKSTNAVDIKIQYTAVVPDPTVTIPSTGGQWVEQIIPLASLGATASRLQHVRIPFIFVNNGTFDPLVTNIDHIRWTKPVSSLIITPATVQVNQGKSREFTVEGRDAANELVIVYPQFTSALGTFTPASGKGQSVVLNVTSASDGQVTAASDGKNVVANVDVTAASLAAQFGILSETIPGMQLGDLNPAKDSELLLFSENNTNVNTLPTLSDVTGFSPEGGKNLKVILRQKTSATQFQGMAMQWGVGASPDTFTRDMSNYYNGSIRFWFKGPSGNTQLRDKLTIGMRSGNVAAGKEVSWVLLKDYAAFNDQWQAVVIPLSMFAQGRPYADLSRMKIFFTMSVAGTLTAATDPLRTVFLDNVRWDTQTPGALATIQVTAASNASAMPFGVVNQFSAVGRDAANQVVDIFPIWSFFGSSLGTFTQPSGPITFLRTLNSPVSSSVRATVGAISGSLAASVVNASFPGVWNVLTDQGAGGDLQVFMGAEGSDTGAQVVGVPDTGAPGDMAEYLLTTYALDNLMPPANDSFAGWTVTTGGTPLQHFDTGYLRFSVRSNTNLEISLASTDIDPNLNRAKVTLAELGVPTSAPGTGAWQQVLIPLAVFKQREPLLDLAETTSLFATAVNSGLVGEITEQYDIDKVEWLSTNVLPNLPAIVNIGEDQITSIGEMVGNGQVDGSDFMIWQRHLGETPDSPNWYAAADMDSNGVVNAADLAIWKAHSGTTVGQPNYDVRADIDLPIATVQFNTSVTDDGKPNPPGTLTVTWSVIGGDPDGNLVFFENTHDPFTNIYIKTPGTYGLKLTAFDGQFNSADTVSVTVEAGGTGAIAPAVAAAVQAPAVENDFIILTPAKSEVRVMTDNQGTTKIETAGTDVSSDFARLKMTFKDDRIDYVHNVTPTSAQNGGGDQSGFVKREDTAIFSRETELLARAFDIVMPFASHDQRTVINQIMNDMGVNMSARPSRGIDSAGAGKAASRGTFFRPSRGEQGKLEFAIPTESAVRIVIYNRFGDQVRVLVNTSMGASPKHVEMWDGKDGGGKVVAPGTYLVDCQIGSEKIKMKAVVSN